MIQKINYADKQTGGKFSASDANEIKSTVNSNADVLSENSQSILSLQGGSLGSIKPTDAAPTPARNGNYTFSIGGNKPAWLTAEPLVTEVKAGDGVAVVYAAPSSYTYTHVDIDSSLKLTDYAKHVFTNNSTLNSFFKELYIDKANYALQTPFEALYCTFIRRSYESSPNYAIVFRLNSSAGAEACVVYRSLTYDESESIVPLTSVTSGLVGYAVVDWNAIPVGETGFDEKITDISYNLKFSPYIKSYLTNIELNSNINLIKSTSDNTLIKLDNQISNQIEQAKEHTNYLLNSGEVGFPEAIFEVDANRVVTTISTPPDAPFDINVLPTIRRFAFISPSNEKKIILDILQGAPKITLSFWTKASQLAACGCTTVRVYGKVGAANAWRYITLPTTIGSVMKNNEDEEMRLEMTAKYGDWICFRFQWENTVYTNVFMFTFNVAYAGELYFANVFLSKSIIDIDPFTVRYKLRNSTLPVLNNKIICWGDSLTAGDGVGVYPNELQTLLGSDYAVVNQGVGGENVPTILARLGSEPMYAPIAYTLPATLSPVLIADGTTGSFLKNSYNHQSDCFPLLQEGLSRINPCYVNGIECELYREIISGGSSTDPAHNKWYIKRITTGLAFPVAIGEPIVMQASQYYRNPKAAIIWVGSNGGFSDAADLVDRIKKAGEYINTGNLIIVNRHIIVDDVADNLLLKTFGSRFFNWRRYVSTSALYRAGITPTTNETLTATQIANGIKSDVQCMSEGLLPSSLWRRAYRSASDPLNDTGVDENSKDGTHMNKKGYQILAQRIKELLTNMGI